MDYTSPSEEMRRKINLLLQAWGEEVPLAVEIEEPEASIKPDRERFTVPHASRDPKTYSTSSRLHPTLKWFKFLRNQSSEIQPRAQ